MRNTMDESFDKESVYSVEEDSPNRDKFSQPDLYHEVYPGTEREEFDFRRERQNENSTNLIESTTYLIKGCLGSGILNIHVSYMIGGLWASLVVTVVIGFLMTYSMYMLVQSAQKLYAILRVPRLTYGRVVGFAVATGPWKYFRKYSRVMRYSVDLLLFIELCGSCCLYEIMIARTLKHVLEGVSVTAANWNLSLRIYVLILMLPLIILSMVKNIKFLVPISIAADLFVGICVLTTVYYGISEFNTVSDKPAFKSMGGLLQFSGMFAFSIDGVGITLPIENNMKQPQYFRTVLQFGMTTVIICVTLVGSFGYALWGETCSSPITIHMPLETVPAVMQFLLVIVLCFTFAINIWIPFKIFWYYAHKRHKRNRGKWERIYRSIHVVVITCCAIGYPHIIGLMIVLGNIFVSLTAFVYPALVDTLVTWREHKPGRIRWRLVKNLSMIAFGAVLLIGALM